MAFDLAGARQAGYSDDDIIGHLTAARKFDIAGARGAGYSNDDIIGHLMAENPADAGGERRPAGFWGGIGQGTTVGLSTHPETVGAGLEAYGRAGEIDWLRRAGESVQEATKTDPASHPEMVPLHDVWNPRDLFLNLRTFLGQQTGQAVGSTLPALVAGGAGAAVGSLAGPWGTFFGGIAGVSADALPANTGDLYRQLQDEGIDKDRAAGLAAAWGPVLTGPDVFSNLTLMKPFVAAAKKEGTKGFARLLAQRVKEGVKTEGLTELGQQGTQEGIVAYATENPDVWRRLESVATAGIAGTLGGGTVGAAGATVENLRALTPTGRTPDDPGPDGGTGREVPPPDAGQVFGLRGADGSVERGVVSSVNDGYVYWRDQDNAERVDTLADFNRDMTAPPAARDAVAGDATTVGQPPPVDPADAAFYPDRDYDALRIKESAGSGVALPHPTYEAFLENARATGASDEEIARTSGISNRADFERTRNQEIGQYVEGPARDAVRRVYDRGGAPFSSNAYAPGEKGVRYFDRDGIERVEPLAASTRRDPADSTVLRLRERAEPIFTDEGQPLTGAQVGAMHAVARENDLGFNIKRIPEPPPSARERDPVQATVLRLRERAVGLDKRARAETGRLNRGNADAMTVEAIDDLKRQADALRYQADRIASQGADQTQTEMDIDSEERAAIQSEPSLAQERIDATVERMRKLREDIAAAEAATNIAPTQEQKSAGNYAKGSFKWNGMEIAVENPRGSTRSGTSPNGEKWAVQLPSTYGYIKRTEGKDGDQVDVYMGPNPEAGTVYVVDQINPETGKFDEHKAMLGMPDADTALAHYDGAFSDQSGPSRRGAVREMSVPEFQEWVKSSDTKKPVSYSPRHRELQDTLAKVGVPVEPTATTEALERQLNTVSGGTLNMGFDPVSIMRLFRPYAKVPDTLMGFRRNGTSKDFYEQKYPHVQPVRVTFPATVNYPEHTLFDLVKGMNKKHAIERAIRNWDGATIEPATQADIDRQDAEEAQRATLYAGFDPASAVRVFRDTIGSVRRMMKGREGKPATKSDITHAMQKLANMPELSGSTLQHLTRAGQFIAMGPSVADMDTVSNNYFSKVMNKRRLVQTLTNQFAEFIAPLHALPQERQNLIWGVLEDDRLGGFDRRNDGRRVAVSVKDGYAGQILKPGQRFVLNQQETAALFKLREGFDRRLFRIAEGMAREQGYTGPFTSAIPAGPWNPSSALSAIRDAVRRHMSRNAVTRPEMVSADRALLALDIAEGNRRKGYVPFNRHGDWYIRVTPALAADKQSLGGEPRLADLTFVETKPPLGGFVSTASTSYPPEVIQKIREMRQKYPLEKFRFDVNTTASRQGRDLIKNLNIPDMEKLMMAMNIDNPKLAEQFKAEVLKKIYEERLAGFRKDSYNIPGYDPDLERNTADYIRSSSSVIANMEYGKAIEDAYTETQQHHDRGVRDFWKQFRSRIDSPSTDAAIFRRFTFFTNLTASIATSLVNVLHTPLVVGTQLGQWAGQLRGNAMVDRALMEAGAAIRIGPQGLYTNHEIVGKTPAEKAMLQELWMEGTLNPAITEDIRGMDIARKPSRRPAARIIRRVDDVMASTFSVSEQAGRVAAALASFRAAHNPAFVAKAREVYRNSASFPKYGTPTEIARWFVNDVHFIGGKEGRPNFAAGPLALTVQFRNYQFNYLRLLRRSMMRMGPEGKIAAGLMAFGLLAAAGLKGWPFVDDIINFADWAVKFATGSDPNFERWFAHMMREIGATAIETEALLNGLTRDMFGINAGPRLGQGEVVPEPDLTKSIPFLSSTVGKVNDAWARYKTGQTDGMISDFSQLFLGKGISDLYRAATMPEQGVRTRAGYTTLLPSEIGLGDIAARAIGFQSNTVARAQEEAYSQSRVKNATREPASRLLNSISGDLAIAEDAAAHGDPRKAAEYERRAQQKIDEHAETLDADEVDWTTIPLPRAATIKQRVRQMLEPREMSIKSAPRSKREEMQRYPLPSR